MAKNKDYKRILHGEIYFPDVEAFKEGEITTRKASELRAIYLDQDDKVVYFPNEIEREEGDGEKIHNKLEEIQGGKIDEYYHLTELEYIKLKALLFTYLEAVINVSPISGEKGVPSELYLTFKIDSNDDEIISALISNGVGNVLNIVNQGLVSVPLPSSKVSQTYVLIIEYDRKGQILNETRTTTYNAYVPQFAGVSSLTDIMTYGAMSSNLTKYVQASNSIAKKSSPVRQYIWFVSSKSNAVIKDQNDFTQNQGVWNNGSTEFYRKEVTILLADGVTPQTLYLFRSRGVKTLTDFIYKIQ